jgi:hypothetical protein
LHEPTPFDNHHSVFNFILNGLLKGQDEPYM